MSDNIDITVIEQPIAVTQAITETPVNIAIAVTDAPLDVNIAVDENTLSVAVAVTESPVAVTVSTVQGIEEAPVDGETYGRKDASWVPVTVTETDPIFTASEAALFAAGDKAKLDGIESGAQVNDPETDPVFAASAAAGIDAGDITNWNAKQDALGFTPVDAASIEWVDLTNGGQTNLHSHAGGGGTWGSITGILSNQTDLQNALNAKVAKVGDTLSGDLIGTDFVKTRSGSITRTGGYISQVAKTGGRTLTIIRTGNYISSISDGTRTWTFTRDGNNIITAWTVA